MFIFSMHIHNYYVIILQLFVSVLSKPCILCNCIFPEFWNVKKAIKAKKHVFLAIEIEKTLKIKKRSEKFQKKNAFFS